MMKQFSNETLTDWSSPANRARMQAEMASVGSQLGSDYPLIIGEKRVATPRKQASLNPCNHRQAVGYVSRADVALAEEAMSAAWRAFDSWKKTTAEARAASVMKLAAVMRRRKAELAAWLVFEVAKNWTEADADVAEAIDFCEFYAGEMLRYSQMNPVMPHHAERNVQRYIPLGVGVVISPWNFPLAILTGMTTAAVVAGNTVIIKPANTAGVIAAKFMETIDEAGFPPGVINYLPGSGAEIGDYLVAHPHTRFISFTGSKEVGIRINKLAACISQGQVWIKRVVAELGGKDCIVVDETADLESAAQAIVKSTFGFQGQKCSACSRAIVVDSVYGEVLDRVLDLTARLTSGPAIENNDVNAVIDEHAHRSIMGYIGIGSQEGRIVIGGSGDAAAGYYVEPTVIADVLPGSRVAQEEIFGPVLSFIRARDFDNAVDIANGTQYGLTGAVFSRSRMRLERASDEMHVGNLYLNRGCTGALVGVHPFGGFNMSGTDSKAGGADYLLLFMQAKAISEAF
ncbi:MAG: L-glutamate gamma-semialdehyde dehydrogenase [Clostridia bacterium]|nr:L-glutamate gamma-semialdehyde dehydrogenase [Clostridia bacterium]